MGNTLGGELPSSWDDDDVIKWKENARAMQQSMYLQFEGSQFHDMEDLSRGLRISKICFAIYGTPSEYVDNLEDAYSTEQRAFAEKIYGKIRETYVKSPEKHFRLGFIFIFCKEGEKEYQVPLFRVLWDSHNDTSRYIDTACRVYESVEDWKKNNSLPMMKYCFPKGLIYTCDTSGAYKFDPNKQTDVEFGTSPACNVISRVARTADVVTSVAALTIGVVTIFTPVGFVSAPILLGTAGTAGVWGTGRGIQRLADKIVHSENFNDIESVLLVMALVAAPLHMLNGLATARLAAGAASGRIFSQTERILATVLMFTTVGVDGFTLVLNVTNLIDKAQSGKLTTLDVLQFSISTFFFTNTLMQPKTAWGVIERAQQQRLAEIASGMTDVKAKETFQKFLEQNKGDGSIKDTSKVVRSLNRMEDPDFFFKSVKNAESVRIAGRKGKTVNISQKDGSFIQANPNNRVMYSSLLQKGMPKIAKQALLRDCLKGDYKSHRYLGNLTERQMGRINKVFGGAAGYRRNIVEYAERLADKMGDMDPDGFMSLVENVAAKVKATPNFNFKDTVTFNNFHAEILQKLDTSREICAKNNLKFANEHLALYHYQKHGEEFMQFCSPEFYLGDLPQDILKNGKLANVQQVTSIAQDNSQVVFTRKTFLTPNDGMLVLLEKEGCKTISTVFKKAGEWAKFMDRFQVTNTPPMKIAFENLALVTGLNAVYLKLSRNSDKAEFSKSEMYSRMVSMLVTNLRDYLDHRDDPDVSDDDENEEEREMITEDDEE